VRERGGNVAVQDREANTLTKKGGGEVEEKRRVRETEAEKAREQAASPKVTHMSVSLLGPEIIFSSTGTKCVCTAICANAKSPTASG
jgi:hypothetical protein